MYKALIECIGDLEASVADTHASGRPRVCAAGKNRRSISVHNSEHHDALE